jgi:hypothetical protein
MDFAVLFGLVGWLLAAFGGANLDADPVAGSASTPAAAAACALAPREPAALARLLAEGEAAPDEAFPLPWPIAEPVAEPPLEPVEPATAAAVEAAATVIAGCFAERQPLAGLAGFSDGLIRRLAGATTAAGFESELAMLARDPRPEIGPAVQQSVIDGGAGHLPDGRVALKRTLAAEFAAAGADEPIRSESTLLFVFAAAADRWLLDDVLVVASEPPGNLEAIASTRSQSILIPLVPESNGSATAESATIDPRMHPPDAPSVLRRVVPVAHTVARADLEVTLFAVIDAEDGFGVHARLVAGANHPVQAEIRAEAAAREVWLEAMAGGATPTASDPPWVEFTRWPDLVVRAEDDLGNRYDGFTAGASGGDAVWDFDVEFWTALDPAARRLVVTVEAVEWRGWEDEPLGAAPRTDQGPWTFEVDLTAGREATREEGGGGG